MNTPPRRQGGTSSPLGRLPTAIAERGDVAGAPTRAVGFDPLADAGQGPAAQRSSLGTILMGESQRDVPLQIQPTTPASFGYLSLPPYVGWVQLFPRVVLPHIAPIPDDAVPTRVGYFNGPGPLPDPADSAAVVAWVKANGVPFHTHFSVTYETADQLIYGTPFSEAAPVFLPAGFNIALFQGTLSTVAWADITRCYLTAISAPINEQLLFPSAPR